MRGAGSTRARSRSSGRSSARNGRASSNSPQGRLDQTHLAVTYLRHPYRNPILGWPEDIARIDVDDHHELFTRRTTGPTGRSWSWSATSSPSLALDRVCQPFRGRRRAVPAVSRRPRDRRAASRSGRRDFALSEPESAGAVLLGWRTVPRGHRDAPTLDVLADLLCCGRRSRLWQSLVETDKTATWIEAAPRRCSAADSFSSSSRRLRARIRPPSSERIAAELHGLREAGPSADELDRVRRRLKAAWRWEQEDLTSLAAGLGTAALWDDWRTWQAEHRAALTVEAARDPPRLSPRT